MFTSSKKILLIEPPFYKFFHYERWYYPLTLVFLGSYLKRLGHEVLIYDADRPSSDCRPLGRREIQSQYNLYKEALGQEDHPLWRQAQETISRIEPDVVGITAISAKIDSANIIAKITRRLYGKKVEIVLGGPHAQGMRAMIPDYNFGEDYDKVVTHIPGLIHEIPDKSLILDVDKYSAKNLSTVLTASGCPNECTFCCHSFEKKMSFRALLNIRNELKQIRQDYNRSAPVSIINDCLFTNTMHFEGICNIMNEFGLSFTAGSRIMSLSLDKIEKFISSGGIHINVGVESGSQRVLDRVKKKLKVSEIARRVKWLSEASLTWSAFLIVGFPFETVDDLKLTEELIYQIKPTFISINRFTPYPGTELYKEYFKNSDVKFRDFFQLNDESCVELAPGMENQINRLFTVFEEYNSEHMAENNFMRHSNIATAFN